jgi:hypothetical protein
VGPKPTSPLPEVSDCELRRELVHLQAEDRYARFMATPAEEIR